MCIRDRTIPDGLDLGTVPLESFPAAMQIGAEMLENGNMLGATLIENAQLAFMEGMIASATVMGIIAMLNAILVKLYMPRKIINMSIEEE